MEYPRVGEVGELCLSSSPNLPHPSIIVITTARQWCAVLTSDARHLAGIVSTATVVVVVVEVGWHGVSSRARSLGRRCRRHEPLQE